LQFLLTLRHWFIVHGKLPTEHRADLRDLLGRRPELSSRAISEACKVAGTIAR
jgi:hypothetical protein